MKKHLNTLFVGTQGAYVAKEGETVAVKFEGKILQQIPVHTIGGIVCFGNITCSPFLMGFCAENDVTISFLSEYGRFLARVQGPVSGNVLLRREQYRQADNMEKSAKIAESIAIGKLMNSRTVLRRALRDHSEKLDADKVRGAGDRITAYMKQIKSESLPLDTIRGYEGEAAHIYFSVFDHLILSQKKIFIFTSEAAAPLWIM